MTTTSFLNRHSPSILSYNFAFVSFKTWSSLESKLVVEFPFMRGGVDILLNEFIIKNERVCDFLGFINAVGRDLDYPNIQTIQLSGAKIMTWLREVTMYERKPRIDMFLLRSPSGFSLIIVLKPLLMWELNSFNLDFKKTSTWLALWSRSIHMFMA